MSKRRLFFIGVSVLLFAAAGWSHQAAALSPKYQKWLTEEVPYISTPVERDVFRKLETDEDRDRFIEEFWNQRDPTPGTPRNEFKEEHYRRIEFANKTFGRGTSFQGWRTERGRIYIILGPPNDVEKIVSSDAYPIEIWYFSGNPAYGQQPFFKVMFFQKAGSGDYVIYNPAGNSPKDLVGNPRRVPVEGGLPRDWDEWDAGAYFVLRERVSVEVANSIFSLIPGNNNSVSRNQSSILLAEVQKYPQKKINDEYALAILEHKPRVEVSYSIHFIGNRTAVALFEDPSGTSSIHYVIVPERLSLDAFNEKFASELRTTLRIADARGGTLFQKEKPIPIELHKDELKALKGDSFQLYDSLPIIPGKWTVSLLLENAASKEFTSVEKSIEVPEPGTLRLSPIVLARKIFVGAKTTGIRRAFQFENLQIYPSVNNVFREKERVYLCFQLLGLSPVLKDQAVLEYSILRNEKPVWTTQKNVRNIENPYYILEELPAERITIGEQDVRVGLRDGSGREILAAQTRIQVTKEGFPGMWIAAQANPAEGDPSQDFILGTQYLNSANLVKAEAALAGAYDKKPDSVEYAVGYAQVLLKAKNASKAREILLPLADSKDAKFEFYEVLGRATRETGDLREAARLFSKALSFRGNVVDALNALGEICLELGDKDQAAKAFRKSLEVNPSQERIRKLAESIRRPIPD